MSARSSLSSLASSTGVRPRRSASLSDTQPESFLPPLQQFPRLGIPSRGARRVTLEEKIRQEREIAREEGVCHGDMFRTRTHQASGYAMREAEEAAEAESMLVSHLSLFS